MDGQEKIFLWPGEAPYTAESPEQEQPSLKAFPVEGSRREVIVKLAEIPDVTGSDVSTTVLKTAARAAMKPTRKASYEDFAEELGKITGARKAMKGFPGIL